MLTTLPKLPYGGITHIADELCLSRSNVANWKRRAIPDQYRGRVGELVADMAKPNGLNNLPYGGVSKIAKRLDRPYTTVSHWRQYGIPLEHRGEVKDVLIELGYD